MNESRGRACDQLAYNVQYFVGKLFRSSRWSVRSADTCPSKRAVEQIHKAFAKAEVPSGTIRPVLTISKRRIAEELRFIGKLGMVLDAELKV